MNSVKTNNEEDEKYEEFIIGVNENGEYIKYTCNPDKLSDAYKYDPNAPYYLTPVFFEREVLKKYFDLPSKYEVGGGYIKCGDEWFIRYGQNSLGLIHVWLGDLGRDLPYKEQLHWKQYNVPPRGGIGIRTIKEELLAEFAEPTEIDDIFKYEFRKFSDFWRSRFGWDLFLPLTEDDEHYMKSLHIPTVEDPHEFEQQILALAKILSDSINVNKIKEITSLGENDVKKLLDMPEDRCPRSIDWLETMLIFYFKTDKTKAKDIVQPLRNIQSLRSSGVAHRKGDKYKKIAERLGLNEKTYTQVMEELLSNIVEMLKQLQELAEKI